MNTTTAMATAGNGESPRCHVHDGWSSACCMARIGSGCCPCRRDPDLDQLLREKLETDYLDEFAFEGAMGCGADEGDKYIAGEYELDEDMVEDGDIQPF